MYHKATQPEARSPQPATRSAARQTRDASDRDVTRIRHISNRAHSFTFGHKTPSHLLSLRRAAGFPLRVIPVTAGETLAPVPQRKRAGRKGLFRGPLPPPISRQAESHQTGGPWRAGLGSWRSATPALPPVAVAAVLAAGQIWLGCGPRNSPNSLGLMPRRDLSSDRATERSRLQRWAVPTRRDGRAV